MLSRIIVLAMIGMVTTSFFSCTKTEFVDKEIIKNDTIVVRDTINTTDTINQFDTVTVTVNTRDTLLIFGDSSSILKLHYDNMVGNQDFNLASTFTINSIPFKFNQFRYWLSNIVLVREDGVEYALPSSYHLMEETGNIDIQDGKFTYPARKREEVLIPSIPLGKYTKIKFAIGIDPTYNGNLSLQSGELSQLNGMTNLAWMWHTSYIFSALKGAQNAKDFSIETGLDANYRKIELNIATPLQVERAKLSTLNIKVDVSKVITGLDLNANPTINASSPASMTTVSDNYKQLVLSVTP